MKREARDDQERFRPRPVERIELNEKHTGRRLAIALVLLGIGAAALTYGIMGLLTPQTGWQAVRASANAGPTAADSFTFLYDLGSKAETAAVTNLYTGVCQRAYRFFHADQEFEDVVNVCTINKHPNEVLEVDPGLYAAFSVFAESGRRELYLGPVYERYDDLFYCVDESQAGFYDPRLSEEVRQEYAGVLVYANDPEAVCLELLGENQVRLNVSQAYLDWAAGESVTRFIDFSWMANAFIADYIAGEMTAAGYTRGSLSSYDGFVRNLDASGTEYSYPLYHLRSGAVDHAADLAYQGPMSFVRLRDYPISEQDREHYYRLSSGEVRTSYLDPLDALCKSAVDTLVCYSREKSCGQLLLEMLPVYVADEFREEAVTALAEEGVQSIYCQDCVVLYTDPGVVFGGFFAGDDAQYTAQQIVS